MSDEEQQEERAAEQRADRIAMLYEKRAWLLDQIADIERAMRELGEEPVS